MRARRNLFAMKRRAAVSVLLAVLLATAASATPGKAANGFDGCVAVGSHGPIGGNRPYDCYYTATGPGFFVATTANPFTIDVSRDGGRTWANLYRRGSPGQPLNGTLATEEGDYVGVSVSCWSYTPPGSQCTGDTFGGRYGAVWAQSDI